MWGISYPGFYAAAGHDRRAPGARGGLAAGADRRPVHGRRLLPQRRVHARRTTSTSSPAFVGRERPEPPGASGRSSTTAPPTAIASSSSWARSRTRSAVLGARRRLTGTTCSSTPPTTSSGRAAQSRRTSSASRRRCSRSAAGSTPRTCPARSPIYRAIESKNPGIDNRLVMGPWSHGGWARRQGRSAGSTRVRQRHRRVLPRPHRVPVLRRLPQRRRRAAICPRRWVFETGTNHWRRHDAGRPPPRASAGWCSAPAATCRCERRGVDVGAGRRRRRRRAAWLRRVRQRSGAAGAVPRPTPRSGCPATT